MADETNVGEATYVLQHQPQDAPDEWTDIATVTVPARTKRRTVLEKGMEQAGITPGSDPFKVRVLSSESAEVFTLEPDPQPARWKVAGS